MSKKEFKLDEEFQFGLLRLKCVRAKKHGYCNGCYFGSMDKCDVGEVGECESEKREDRTDVMFVNVEQ